MQVSHFRRAPVDAEAVWAVGPDEKIQFGLRYVVLTIFFTLLVTLTATLGTISFSSDDKAIASFWPAAAFQIVLSIWFGIYGAIAGIIGPMLGNAVIGGSPFLFISANAVQSCLTGLWFRHRRLDPRLRSRRDWFGAIVVGCLLSNLIGAGLGVTESYTRSAADVQANYQVGYWINNFVSWFAGNAVPCLVLVPALLKAASAISVRGPLFCQRFWGGTGRSRGIMFSMHFSDIPIMAKLGFLIVVSGLLPLSIVAGWSVWGMVERVNFLAAQTNKDVAREIRNEVERHALLLNAYARRLERAGPNDVDIAALLLHWQEVPETFSSLEVIDVAQVESRMTASVREAFRELPVGFYHGPARSDVHAVGLWGVVRLGERPDKVLTGRCEWRSDQPLTARWAAHEAIIVYDNKGNELFRHGPPKLADWRPEPGSGETKSYKMRYGGEVWHVAEASIPRHWWRFVTVTSARTGLTTILESIPNTVAGLINLSIFGSLIAGGFVARRISERVLAIAEHVRDTGPEPGMLAIPVRGEDELGYLAQTLNRMSGELKEYVDKLRETTAEKERLAAEMELARQVQMSILPHQLPDVAGYEFAALCNPAREVGGDFYDVFCNREGRIVIMIGDATGKGLKAAMFVTQAHGSAHWRGLNQSRPDAILSEVNAAILSAERPSSEFVTMFFAVLDPQEGRLYYCSAGHPPGILVRQGRSESLELGGLPLAIEADGGYELCEVKLELGDAVVMYSDGVTEAMNAERQEFGQQRLEEVVSVFDGAGAEGLAEEVVRHVREFAGPVPQSDDLTLVVVSRNE